MMQARVVRRLLRTILVASMLTALSAQLPAATPANAASPLGMNLLQLSYYTPAQPFLDIFKTTGICSAAATGWITHSESSWDTREQQYLQLDPNGYPKTLRADSSDPHSPQLFDSVGVLLLRDLPPANAGTGLRYRPGGYVVLYDGQGTLSYAMDAQLVKASPGRDLIEVAHPSGAGIDLRITSTDPRHNGDYLRNIRVVKAEEEQLLRSGQMFRPGFVQLLQRFRVLRGVQWLNVDELAGGQLTDWASRPLLTDAGWSSKRGAPLEVVLQICNAVSADCWLNVPHQASDDYITQMARLAHSQLGSAQKIYIEFSNEVWNADYEQYRYAIQRGKATWPTAGAPPDEYNRSWYGMRTAQMCDIWKAVWAADGARVVCVLAAQLADLQTAIQALLCPLWVGRGNGPCFKHHIDAVAVAGYFGFAVPAAWTAQPDGGLGKLFASMRTQNDPSIPPDGWLGAMSRSLSDFRAALDAYKLPLIGYEGGQSFVGFPKHQDGSPLVNLYIAANRDPRMGEIYTDALKRWKANGGQLWVLFGDIFAPGQYGVWGALESYLDTVDPLDKAPPKWQAIQSFISSTPCWWPACDARRSAPTAPLPGGP